MIQTDYEIEKEDTMFNVLHCGSVVAKGFFDIESALHAVWVTEGKDPTSWFYEVNNGAVVKETREVQSNG